MQYWPKKIHIGDGERTFLMKFAKWRLASTVLGQCVCDQICVIESSHKWISCQLPFCHLSTICYIYLSWFWIFIQFFVFRNDNMLFIFVIYKLPSVHWIAFTYIHNFLYNWVFAFGYTLDAISQYGPDNFFFINFIQYMSKCFVLFVPLHFKLVSYQI